MVPFSVLPVFSFVKPNFTVGKEGQPVKYNSPLKKVSNLCYNGTTTRPQNRRKETHGQSSCFNHSKRLLLGGRLELMEEDGQPIPAPSRITDIAAAGNERVCLVDVYMPSIRMAEMTRAVKRTVTLPAWMNAKAMELGINFSQVLQESLQKRIGSAGDAACKG